MTLTTKIKPIVRLPGEGDTLETLGISMVQKARSEETDNVLHVMEYTCPPKMIGVVPPHYHQEMTEAMYVLRGELTIILGDEKIKAPAGSFTVIPPNQIHTFNNESDEHTTFLFWVTSPNGFDRYFDELTKLFSKDGPPDMAILQTIVAKYDVVNV